jgi:hypothetical protein
MKTVKKKSKITKSKNKTQKSKKIDKGFSKKLWVLTGLLVVLSVVLIFGGKESSKVIYINNDKGYDAKMIIESDLGKVNVGDVFTVRLYSDSSSVPVNAVSANLAYDKELLEFSQIRSDGSQYDINAYEKAADGAIEISRGSVDELIGKKFIAEIDFKAIKSGNADLIFDKSKTLLVNSSTNQNILDNESFNNLTTEVN